MGGIIKWPVPNVAILVLSLTLFPLLLAFVLRPHSNGPLSIMEVSIRIAGRQ